MSDLRKYEAKAPTNDTFYVCKTCETMFSVPSGVKYAGTYSGVLYVKYLGDTEMYETKWRLDGGPHSD